MSVSLSIGLILCLTGQAVPGQGQTPSAPRFLPPDLVAQSLADPPEAPLAGQSWTLTQSLSASVNRPQQQAIAQAYWKLVEAVAKYNFARDQGKRLRVFTPRPGEDAVLRAAQSSAAARQRQAELSVSDAQFTLAALIRMPPQSVLPWPTDLPHVGGYRTYYQEISARGRLPENARLIDRLLPMERLVIEGRTLAVQATLDVLAAVEADYQAGRADLAAVIAALEKKYQQETVFIKAVCRYNQDIAEYAFAAAPPGLAAPQLASFLIQTGQDRLGSSPTLSDPAVRPAGHTELTPTPETLSGLNQPAPAIIPAGPLVPVNPPPVGKGGLPTAHSGQGATPGKVDEPFSKDATPRSADGNANGYQLPPFPASTPGNDPFAPQKSEPTPAKRPPSSEGAPSEKTPAAEPTKSDANPPLEIPELRTSTSVPRRVSKEVFDFSYATLQQADPAIQTKQLTLALHGNRTLPERAGKLMTLEDCLSRLPGGDRNEALAAYWTASQRTAEFQVFVEQRSYLDRLTSQDATEALQLRASQLDAQAAMLDAHARLLEAQYSLARQTQATAEAEWPLPATAPHFGRYDMNFEAQLRQITESWPMRRLASAIPQFNKCLKEQAAAVIDADAARADAAKGYDAGQGKLATLLSRVHAQTQDTLEFLQTQTDYNRAIAEYALTVLPSETPSARLVAALVVKP